MINRLEKYLKSPVSEKKLQIEDKQNIIKEIDGDLFFEIIGGVPVLLPKKAYETELAIKDSNLNKNFKYIEHYKKDAEEFDYYRNIKGAKAHTRRRIEETIISQISESFETILDVGCGRAWVAKNFVKKNVDVISFDLALANTTKALKKYPANNHFAVVGDALNPPFQENVFDYIVASEIIEHVPDPEKFVTSLFSLLKPDGKLIITTPYKEKLKYSMCIHCNQKTPHNAHIHSFDEENLFKLHNQKNLAKAYYKKFYNKTTEIFRLHVFQNILPYKLWKLQDKITNGIINKPARIMVVFEKSSK